jgi:uncharacterized cupredoxin-like copper-binding protein
MKWRIVSLGVVAALAVGVFAGGALAAKQKLVTTKINVSAFEMGFKLSKTVVKRGTVIFTVKNDGDVAHDFSFGSRGGGTTMLEPGATATLKVKFLKPGNYTYICTVAGHQEAGMIGVLKVKK